MAEINFIVDSAALQTISGLKLSANFEETKASLAEICEPYANLVVTEDILSGAKSDRAKIRKVEKQIDEYRKMVKKAYSVPLNEFETKCKELTAICANASGNIDAQLKVFEEERKSAKRKLIEDYFKSLKIEYPGYISIDFIFDPRWCNATYSLEDIFAEIDRAVSDSDNAVSAIKDLRSVHESALLMKFSETRDLAACLRYKSQLEAIEERRREQEAARSREKAESQKAVNALGDDPFE